MSHPDDCLFNTSLYASGLRDLVPAAVRRQWTQAGYYPNQTLYQLFVQRCQQHPHKPAIITQDLVITYQALLNKAQRLGASFMQMGIVNGDVIAYQLSNRWQCCAIDLAAAAIGAIVAPLPPGRGSLDMQSLLNRCSARALIVEHSEKNNICSTINALRPTTLSLRFPIVITSHRKATHHPGWQTFATLLNTPALKQYPSVSANAAARLLVSSGTESEPKLVAYSHNALIGGRARFLQRLLASATSDTRQHSTRTHDAFRALYLVPLGSAFGSTATVGALAYLGGSLVLIPGFDVTATINAIADYKPTHLLGVPTMFQRIAADPALSTINKSSLVSLIAGGALIDASTIRRCEQAFNCTFINLYGSADGVNCHNRHDDIAGAVYYSVGRPAADICDIRIVNNQGASLPRETTGDICARGPITPLQYVNAPALDQRYRDQHGWVYTGDRGKIDKRGYLILEGRKKDIIIRGGVNISPAQIEQLLATHPGIVSSACIALADCDLGQRVGLCVTFAAGAPRLPLKAINDYLLSRGLEKNKLPEYLSYYKQLPLSPAGKIDKKQLIKDMAFLTPDSTDRLRKG